MATQTVEFRAASGLTLTVRLFAVGSDTIVQTASSCTEATNRKGTYAAVFTDPGAGEFELVALSSGVPVCRWFVTLTLTTATFQAYEVRTAGVVAAVTVGTNNDKSGYSLTAGTGLGNQTANITGNVSGSVGSVTGAVGSVTSGVTVTTNNDKTGYSLTQAFPTNFASLGINSSGHVLRVTLVDTTTTNTDMRGTDNAALASAWTATRAGYLDGVLIAANYNQRTVQVTGSNHVAADIHQLQPAVITDAAFAAGWLTAAGTAADYVTELQTAIGTATNQTAILDRVSFALSALAGACSDAQTTAETYVLSIGGNTYTVDYSGLDASGNRSTTTLTKA